jgi:hypothetical protein
MPKMIAKLYVIEDYENEPPSGPKKQTQNKPNFFKGQNRLPENLATHPVYVSLLRNAENR